MRHEFQTMIEWIEEVGMENLRSQHKQYTSDEVSFSDYVEQQYDMNKDAWENTMNNPKSLEIALDFDTRMDCDPSVSGAVNTFVALVNSALEDGALRNKIDEGGDAPDAHCASMIVNQFNNVVVPAIEQCLENIIENH